MINYAKILEYLPSMLDSFDISYKIFKNRLGMPCPIHSGDKHNALSIYTDSGYGNWKCFTKGCNQNYDKNVLGFIHGLLENQYQKKYSIQNVIKWIEDFTKSAVGQATWTPKPKKEPKIDIKISRSLVRQSLKIPCNYFLNRGFLPETLDRYDVGYCGTTGKQFFGRSVVPVYNDDYTYMIGAVGRSLNPKCLICNNYHSVHDKCPITAYDEYNSSKWVNSSGFNKEFYFYNFWFAKEYIKKQKTVILVEGQGDIWALEESNIKIGLGIFGTSLSINQLKKLKSININTIIIATDNDVAGIKAKYDIMEQLDKENLYKIIPISLPCKDLGDLKRTKIKEIFNSIL